MIRLILTSLLACGAMGTAAAQEMPEPEPTVQTSVPPITISDSPVVVSQIAGEVPPAAADSVEMAKMMMGLSGKSSVILTNNTSEERTAQFSLPEGFSLEGGGDSISLPSRSSIVVKFTYQLQNPPEDRMIVPTEETVVVTIEEDPNYSGEFPITGVYLAMKAHGPL